MDMNATLAYSLLLGIGASFGLLRIFLRYRSLDDILKGLWVLAGALAGARLGYVLLHPEYFSNHRGEMIQFWLGGLDGLGAYLGGVLFTLLLAVVLRIPVTRTLDTMISFLLPIGTAAWLGSWVIDVSYGNILPSSTWRDSVFPDAGGSLDSKFPLQLIAALSLFLLLLLVERFCRHTRAGLRFTWISLAFSLHTLIFNMLGDDARLLLGLRSNVLLFGIVSAILFIILFLQYLIPPKKPTIETNIIDLEVHA